MKTLEMAHLVEQKKVLQLDFRAVQLEKDHLNEQVLIHKHEFLRLECEAGREADRLHVVIDWYEREDEGRREYLTFQVFLFLGSPQEIM